MNKYKEKKNKVIMYKGDEYRWKR